jgi:hypothetical protein
MNRHNRLNIQQYNVRRSRDMVMASLLRDPEIYDFDIIAIQEPWKSPYTATTQYPAKDRFHLCYAIGDKEGLARVCFFVNQKLDQTKWRFKERTRDICFIIINIDPTDDQQSRERLIALPDKRTIAAW